MWTLLKLTTFREYGLMKRFPHEEGSGSDVTVYMRRGQFFDKPDVKPNYISRRSGSENDVFQQHVGGEDEYEAPERGPPEILDPQFSAKALPDSWRGIGNAEHLVDKLRKFKQEPVGVRRAIAADNGVQVDMTPEPQQTPLEYYKLTTSPPRGFSKLISITPNAVLFTDVFDRGDSKIIMRNFQVSTMRNIDPDSYNKLYPGDYMDKDEAIEAKYEIAKDIASPRKQGDVSAEVRPTRNPNLRIRENDPATSSATMIMRHWGPTTTPIFQDYTDEVDEDTIVYKPG